MVQKIYIINARGEKEPFCFRKVYRSARRVGADHVLAREIARTIESEVAAETETVQIFKRVKKLLSQRAPGAAFRFNLKEAMRKLGPTGFPFEKYIGEIFSKNGYQVKLNQQLSGRCCSSYEIDFLAQQGKTILIGECKYHNLAGKRVDMGVALENHARFLDIKNSRYFTRSQFRGIEIKSLLATNTKFTNQAIKYCYCVGGVELLGWDYPKKQGLEDLIDEQKLYPITILPSFKKFMAEAFIKRRLMMARDILKLDIKSFSRKTGLGMKHLEPLAKEAEILLDF